MLFTYWLKIKLLFVLLISFVLQSVTNTVAENTRLTLIFCENVTQDTGVDTGQPTYKKTNAPIKNNIDGALLYRGYVIAICKV